MLKKQQRLRNYVVNQDFRKYFTYAHVYDPHSKTVNLVENGHKVRFYMQKNKWTARDKVFFGTLKDLQDWLDKGSTYVDLSGQQT